jgi:peptide deformylase
MRAKPILIFFDPHLSTPALKVEVFDEKLRAIADDLLDTMSAAPDIGISGPHIGVLKRVVLLELPRDRVRVYINPRIVRALDEGTSHAEGSISMPGITETIEHPARVHIRCRDLGGVEQAEEADGLLAVCLQHEIDQIDGIFWINRLSRLRRERVLKKFEKMRRSIR